MLAYGLCKVSSHFDAKQVASLPPILLPHQARLFLSSPPPDCAGTGKYTSGKDFDAIRAVENKALEQEIAKEEYDILRGNLPVLVRNQLMDWEDVADVIELGIIDRDGINSIIESAGVSGEEINFEEFLRIVDMINEISLILEGENFLLEPSDEEETL